MEGEDVKIKNSAENVLQQQRKVLFCGFNISKLTPGGVNCFSCVLGTSLLTCQPRRTSALSPL